MLFSGDDFCGLFCICWQHLLRCDCSLMFFARGEGEKEKGGVIVAEVM